MSDLQALIAKLEAASEGSRELDAAIWRVDRWRDFSICYHNAALGRPQPIPDTSIGFGKIATEGAAPRYTSSLDAALMLLPKQIPWKVGTRDRTAWAIKDGDPDVYWADITSALPVEHPEYISVDTAAPIPALAFCIAALKWRASR